MLGYQLIFIFFMAIAVFAYFRFKRYMELRNFGEKTMAIVISKESPGAQNQVIYRFRLANGENMKGDAMVSGTLFKDIILDERIEIIYDPKNPSISQISENIPYIADFWRKFGMYSILCSLTIPALLYHLMS